MSGFLAVCMAWFALMALASMRLIVDRGDKGDWHKGEMWLRLVILLFEASMCVSAAVLLWGDR